MSNKKNRSGTSQNERSLAALQPDYVSVEERSTAELLAYLREYAQYVAFYDENNQNSDFWTAFLDFKDDQILELAEFIEDPTIFNDDSTRLERYSKPHLALLLTFLKLLQYPKEQFAALTEKNVEYFYKNVLQLEEQDEVPDQVHVIFTLAKDVKEHLLESGTLLKAGKDDAGVDLHYQVTEDVVLNTAKVTDIKTIHLSKTATDLRYVHQSNNQGDAGFETMLCLVLGGLSSLPDYKTASGQSIPVDAAYLRTDLYKRIQGKERDDLNEYDADYIFDSLCFRSLKDFMVCLNLLYREINRGYAGVVYPEDQEWEAAYTILAGVHEERIARSRRTELKGVHHESGFEAMMEYAFGEPNPGDMLYKMPNGISNLQDLADATNEAARQYIENKLCMTVEDLRTIMAKRDVALTTVAGEEVYTLLEKAWTLKRGYQYPKIGSEIIDGFYADTIFDANTDDGIERFGAFTNLSGTNSSQTMNLGFAVSSPLLNLAEGNRGIDLILSCKEGTFASDQIAGLGVNPQEIFATSLSTADGWRKADDVDFEMGKFIIKPELKTYDREDSSLVCDITQYAVLNEDTVGAYVGFANGKVYQIESIDETSGKMDLKSTSLERETPALEQTTGSTQLITRLIPKTFVTELAATLELSRYDLQVTSTVETFDENFKNKYFVDNSGQIFLVRKFLGPKNVEVGYCGSIKAKADAAFSDSELLLINKVWESVELEYDEDSDLSGLVISGIHSAEKGFIFDVSDAAFGVSYPEGATSQELLTAWEKWKDQEGNSPGRYRLQGAGTATAGLSEVSNQELKKTGEIIKRYESLADNGILITYQGRPVDSANLMITAPSESNDQASFLVSGGTLTITPGLVSQTANQIAADWRLWIANGNNDANGFRIESKDEHVWEAVSVSEMALNSRDRQVKKCEIYNLYGVGIRVWYQGPVADEPKLVLKENSIDLFEFEISEDQTLTIKYPSTSETSANDLLEAWEEWKASELNNPGNFSIETMGDGLWTIQARMEKELQSSENRVIECTINEAGIIARYTLSDDYQNALIEFVKNEAASDFSFSYSDVFDEKHNQIAAKKLTISYPPLKGSGDDTLSDEIKTEYRIRQTQALLSKWNREYKKNGFSLMRISDDAQWAADFPDSLSINFMDDLNYVGTIQADGFVVKYKPNALAEGSPYTEVPKAKVVIQENDTKKFAFQLLNDYANNLKILYINYPTAKNSRTVSELLKAWNNETGALIDDDSLYWTVGGTLSEFQLVSSGSGKWQITAETNIRLTNEVSNDTALTDPIRYRFFEYKTSDVNGFTVHYAGPEGVQPQVTFVQGETDNFEIEVSSSYNEFYDVYIGQKLTIKYPQRSDKRRMVDLLTAWYRYTKDYAARTDWILGFEIFDTSLILERRSKSALLTTGDLVREFQTGDNGVSISYIGHRDAPVLTMAPIEDFAEDITGAKVLWDNGEIFTIAERTDQSNVTVESTTDTITIASYDSIKLYEAEAICLDALKFSIQLDEDFSAVTSLSGENISGNPVIKILLNQTTATGDADSVAIFYNCLKSVCLERIDLKVRVSGLTDLKLRGNLAMINPENPFNPFGQSPNVPARFYIASSEICEKKLDTLQFNINWAEKAFLTPEGLPDMEDYYYAYSHSGLRQIGTIRNEDFEVALQFLDDRSWVALSEKPQNLLSNSWYYDGFGKQTYQGALFAADEELPKDPLDWPRYYKVELGNQGFLNDYYGEMQSENARATRSIENSQSNYDTIKQEIQNYQKQVKAAKQAEAEARDNNETYYQPVIASPRELPALPENDKDISDLSLNAPYTPVIQSMTIDYTASGTLKLDTQATNTGSTRVPLSFFHYHPFGYEQIAATDENDYLLPQYEKDGYLMIGLSAVEPSQTVSLLFQMVSGSGDASITTPDINWSYLASNQWVAFKDAEILKDKTYGLEDTGMIRFGIPEAATTDNTVLPEGRIWIRAEAAENIAAVPDILDIRAQAVGVIYLDQGNDPAHLAAPLAADSITELETRDAAVKEIEQPYSSFDGKMKETDSDFYIRISERLKHKNRALTLDDYEKLILAKFPQIHKVKCVPQQELVTFEPTSKGKVVVVVILKNANATPFFPLKPKTPANLLSEIEEYIQELMPPFVNVSVRNPRFEEITYRLAVKFTDGYDRGFYLNQLNDDIKSYLSPWAYEQDAEINFGSAVYSSSLINYLENKPYIDYVANFNPMQQTIQHDTYTEVIPLFLTDDNMVTTKYHDSILVSADSHVIDVITTELYDPSAFQGIGYMKIGSDFWISRPGATFSVGLGEMEIEAWPVLQYAFTTIPVSVKVKASVQGTPYTKDNLATKFSRGDSRQIWDALKDFGYIDETGHVVTTEDLYADNFHLFGGEGEFAGYLNRNLSEFTFQVQASDFDPAVGKQSDFSYTVQQINTNSLETAVVNLLKNGLAFDGISQYPFIVY